MLFNTDTIALMAFASEDVVNQWRAQVIEAERNKDQVLDVTGYTRVAHRDTYTRIPHQDTYSRTASSDIYSQSAARDTYTRVAHTDTYTRTAARDTYTRVAHTDTYTRTAARDSYSRVDARDTYTRVAHTNTYSRVAHTNTYSRVAHTDSYSRTAHRDSYSRSAHADSYSRAAHRDSYSRTAARNSYSRRSGYYGVTGRRSGYRWGNGTGYSAYVQHSKTDRYTRSAHRDSYTRSAHRDSYSRTAHRDSYSRTAHRDSYSKTAARDSYSQTAARDTYSQTVARDTYSRVAHTNTYSRATAADTYSRTDARDTYSRVAASDTYSRTDARDTYTRTAHTDTYSRGAALDTYSRVPAQDTYSRVNEVHTGFDHENYIPSTPEFYDLDGKVISDELEIRLASYDKNADGFGSQDFASIDIYYDVQIRQVQDVQGNAKVTEWVTLQHGSMTEDFDVSLSGYEDGMYEVRSIAYNQPRTENGVTKTYVSGEKIATFMIINGEAGQDLTILNAPEFQDYIYGIDTYVNRSDEIKKYVDSIIYEKSENQKGLFLEINLEDEDVNSYHKTKAALEVNGTLITDKYNVVYETNNDGTPKSGDKIGVVFIPLADMLDNGAFEDVKIHLETEEYSDPGFTKKRGDTSTQYGINQARDVVYIDVDGENPTAIVSDPPSQKVLSHNVAIAYSDVGLGLRKKEYQINGGDWIEASSAAESISLTDPGEYVIRARATDKAGNVVTSAAKTFTISSAEQQLTVPETIYQGESFYAIGDIETNMDIIETKFWIQDSVDKETGNLVSEEPSSTPGRTNSQYSALIETAADIPLGTHVVYMTVVYEDGIQRTISQTITVVEATDANITPQESDKDGNPIDPYLILDENDEDTLIIQKGDKFTPLYYQKTVNGKGEDISDKTTAESFVPVDETGHANKPGKYDVIYTSNTSTTHTTFTLHVIVNDPPKINAGTTYLFTGELRKEDLLGKIVVNDKEDGRIDLTVDDLEITPKGNGEYEVTITAEDSMKGRSTKKIVLKTIDFSEMKDGPRFINKDTLNTLSSESIWTEEEYNQILQNSLDKTTPIYEENIHGND